MLLLGTLVVLLPVGPQVQAGLRVGALQEGLLLEFGGSGDILGAEEVRARDPLLHSVDRGGCFRLFNLVFKELLVSISKHLDVFFQSFELLL